jgi:hypothetical protein
MAVRTCPAARLSTDHAAMPSGVCGACSMYGQLAQVEEQAAQ